jgi:2'-5' RNA ligase
MSRSRLILMAMPSPAVRAVLLQAVRDLGLEEPLGPELFDPENWHQSFSDAFPDSPDFRDALRRACGQLSAAPFTLSLNRIGGEGHWAFNARGKPEGFTALLSAVRSALKAERITDVAGHSPHVTVSYRAPYKLASTRIEPIEWLIDEILLVRGGGDPYRYEVLGRWPLVGEGKRPGPQMSLLL